MPWAPTPIRNSCTDSRRSMSCEQVLQGGRWQGSAPPSPEPCHCARRLAFQKDAVRPDNCSSATIGGLIYVNAPDHTRKRLCCSREKVAKSDLGHIVLRSSIASWRLEESGYETAREIHRHRHAGDRHIDRGYPGGDLVRCLLKHPRRPPARGDTVLRFDRRGMASLGIKGSQDSTR